MPRFPLAIPTVALACLTLLDNLPSAFAAAQPPIRASLDGRFLETATGEPFIWIGDTAWELFHRLDREEAIHYLDTRAEQGFTVVQAVLLAELDGLQTPNAYGHLPLVELDPTQPNEAYFEHVDFIVEAAAERGLVMALLPTWGDKVISLHPGAGPVVFDADNAQAYGGFLGERYQAAPVVWMLGGDRNVDHEEARAIWRAMADGIRSASRTQQLITFHPRGASHSAWFFHNEDWLAFNTYQSGHDAHAVPVYRFAEAAAHYQPRKPFVDAEPAYEDIAIRFWDYVDFSKSYRDRVPDGVIDSGGVIARPEHFQAGFITDHDVRRHAYWNMLAGAAGYTYGNNAVWQMFRRGEDAAIPPLTDWREALQRPGAQQMRHLKTLWEIRPFGELRPDQALIVGQNPPGPEHQRAALAHDGSFALIYAPVAASIRVHLPKLAATQAKASWFNPRTGERQVLGSYPSNQDAVFVTPATDAGPDWLLVIDAAAP